ncbi:hypothetical protein BJY04DRAFT_202662 [Aspergillus karnatakaensis]|uniref:NmrA/HSCARG family protein n=1 Tax=Aspergillus karnatakaensis TaxID=1810916 RepID=UPI003CCDBE01
MASQPVIVVLGATGNQGRGVVQALLREPSPMTWQVRAITRNPDSDAAQDLLNAFQTPDNRLSLHTGDLYDKTSLEDAFTGAYGVFGVTSEYAGKTIPDEEGMKHELQAGRNIIDAAKKANVKHFVFSSLPNMNEVTGGRLTRIYHMTHKSVIAQWAKEELPAVTCLIPGLFLSNLNRPQYCCRREDGVVRFCPPIPAIKLMEWVDPEYDMGLFAARVFSLGPDKTSGKSYFVGSKHFRMQDLASTFTRLTGQPAVYDPITLDDWADMTSSQVGPGFREDARQMMEWFSTAPEDKRCYGAMEPAEDTAYAELGVEASSFEDWVKRYNWAGP